MQKVVEDQLIRTEHLQICLDIVKLSGTPEVECLISALKTSTSKAEELLEKREKLIEEKKRLQAEVKDVVKALNVRADMLERVAKIINRMYNLSTQAEDNENQVPENQVNACSSNVLEVSPCPSEWANGALNTPRPQYLSQSISYFAEDFQTEYIRFIDPEEMTITPAYMKGRLTCENVNSFIDTINCVLKKKYAIVNLKKKEVKRKDLTQYSDWKSQEKEYQMSGQIYFTTEDLATLGSTKLDKMSDKIIQILRHTKRLRQTQVNKKLVLYIVI